MLKIAKSNLKEKTESLLKIIQKDPFVYPPSFEKLQGKLNGLVSRRINKQHRLVYQVLEVENTIKKLLECGLIMSRTYPD